MKTISTSLMAMAISLFFLTPHFLNAQCSGTVTLSTQAQVNAFTCTSFTGTLIIEDDNNGVDDIVDLDPIYVNGMTPGNNAIVTGDLIVRNCDNLSNIGGLDGIIEIQGDFIQEDNVGINAPVPFSFSLTEIGGSFIFRNNPNAADVNYLFSVQDVGGSLIIENNASMTFVQSFNTTTSIGGNLILKDNASLNNLNGLFLDDLLTIGGSLILENNDDLASWIGIPTLTSVGSIRIDENDNLAVLQGFGSLTTFTDNNPLFWVRENNNLTEIKDFDNLTNIDGGGSLFIENNSNLVSVNDFDNLSDVNTLHFQANVSLTNMPTFPSVTNLSGNFLLNYNSAISDYPEYNNITSIDGNLSIQDGLDTELSGFSGLSSVGGNFTIEDIPDLTSVTAFPNLGSIGGIFFLINNSSLSDCCWALPLIDVTAGSISIFGNATGCESQSAIGGAAPAITCIADFSVSANTGTCAGDVTMTDPSPTDDCGVITYTIDLVDANGTVIYNGIGASGGFVETLNLPVGVNTYTYTATDDNGNVSTCQTLVTVTDNEAPAWTDTDNTITVIGECGIDDPVTLYNANLGVATDNCMGITYALISTVVNAGSCGSSEQVVYTMEATDASGNKSVPYTVIIELEDTTAPVLSPVPADATIFCNDTAPAAPALTATDQCAGDISANIVVTENSLFGNCTNGTQQEERTYTYTIDDGCGNVSTASWTLFIQNDFEVDLGPDVSVCDLPTVTLDAGPGNTYSWSTGESTQTITVTGSGIYTVDVISNNGCCESDAIEVFFDSAPNASAMGAQLDCTGNAVQIMGNSTTSVVFYSWTGPGGFTSMVQNPMVTAVGTYILTVTNANGCTETANAVVTANTNVPDLSASGGTISCTVTSVQLMSNSTVVGVTYAWTGPGGFTSAAQNPTVTVTGTYTVTVTAPNGCVASTTTEVINNTTAPSATASAGVITCAQMTTQIMTTASANAASFSWTGPGGFTSTDEDPTVSEVGMYTVVITAANGCAGTATVMVTGNFATPNASAQGATKDCSSNQVLIMGNSTTANVSYSWVGPNGFTSNLQNPLVSDLGIYTLTVMAQNGCTSMVMAEVLADDDLPQISGTGGTIDCNNTSVQMMGSSTTPNVTLSWTGPNGFTSSDMNPTVTIAGTYVLTVMSSNGCSITQNVAVVDDTAEPVVTLSLGDADCDAGTRQIVATSTTSGLTVSWTGPNGFTSNEFSPSISASGTYTMETFPANGCNSTHTIEMDDDVAFTANVTSMDITAGNPSGSASITITGGTGPFTIMWDNGETGDMATDLTAGDHTVTVTDGLGCVQVFDFFIDDSTSAFEEEWKNDIKLYPSPTNSVLNIELQESVQFFHSIQVFDVNGKLVKAIAINPSIQTLSISVSDWTSGIYIARINAATSSYSLRFMVD